MIQKSKQTIRQKMMEQNLQEQSIISYDAMEKEALSFINEFNTTLNCQSETLKEYYQECLVFEKNQSWIPYIEEMRNQIKSFNSKRESDRDLNLNLSNKRVNTEIHQRFSTSLNLLASIINDCSKIIKVLQDNMYKTNAQLSTAQNGQLSIRSQTQIMSLNDRSTQCQHYLCLQNISLFTNQVLKTIKIIVKNNSIIQLSMTQPEEFLDNLLLLMLWNGWTGEIEQKIFKNTIVVFEACLVSMSFVFNANTLKNMNTFMESIQHRELSHFLRVLALLVLEVNDKSSFKAISKGGGCIYMNNHIVMNHSLLINQPLFLHKVFDIAVSMIDVITNLMDCRHETQLREAVDILTKNQSLDKSGICLNELLKIFVQHEFSARYRNLLSKKFMIEYCLKNSSLMELLFILQNLLSGRKKTIVQSQLNSFDFVDNVLIRLYDILFHKEFNLEEIVSEQDEDSQDICFTARIQLLRLIINFIDRDEDNIPLKAKLISKTEHFFLQNVQIPLIIYLHHPSHSQNQSSSSSTQSSTAHQSQSLILQVQQEMNQGQSSIIQDQSSQPLQGSSSTNVQSLSSSILESSSTHFIQKSQYQVQSSSSHSIQGQTSLQSSQTLIQDQSCLNASQLTHQTAQQQGEQLELKDQNNCNREVKSKVVGRRVYQVSSLPNIGTHNSTVQEQCKQKRVDLDGVRKYNQLLEDCADKDILEQENYIEGVVCEKLKKQFEELVFPTTLNKQNIIPYKRDRIDCTQDKGLMHRIIDLLKRINENCQLRFWLGSCVEAFLRGSHWYLQNFVFQTGLLYLLTNQFILNKLLKANNIQITLDILSELIKFSQLNVMYLNALLVEEDWIKKVDQRMFKNIVDTNLFLRNLYLTYEQSQFKKTLASLNSQSNGNKNNMLFKILCENNLFRTLTDLIECVNEDNLSQDNLCCINSALVILVFDNSRGNLQATFCKMAKYFAGRDSLVKYSKVLQVWLDYQSVKVKEFYCLQYATKINFYYFKQVVNQFNLFVLNQQALNSSS